MENHEIVVSVCIITYNQEKFISKAIDSVLAQKVSFKYELVISDDASIDKTQEIIHQYKDKYPEIFSIRFRENNVGVCTNVIENIKRCKGKYFAYLEGDDYWIDENKLQKQFDFMEAHPDVAFCYTNTYSFFDANEEQKEIMIKNNPSQNIFDLDYYIKESCFLMPTLTLFIRKNAFPKSVPAWLYYTFNLDWALNILYLQKGKAAYLDEITAMYRMHKGGITSSTYFPTAVHNGIKLVKNIDRHFKYKYHNVFGKVQWRYYQLVVYYFQKNKFLIGFYWLIFSFFRNPIAFITDTNFLKTLYKVTFQSHEVYN